MNLFRISLLSAFVVSAAFSAEQSSRKANLVVLDATGVKNLRIETAVAEPGDFEETVFALGAIEAKSGSVASVSSRISGRIVSIQVIPGDEVAHNAEVAKVESRQPGNPSPVIGLRAPLAGMITRVDSRLGDPVEPDRALLEITDLREVYAVARVPENLAAKVTKGATAHIVVSAVSTEPFEGTLIRFGTAADQASGTVDAIFVLRNDKGIIRPGMRAEFSIVVGRRSGVVSVPRSALQGDPAGRFIYVKDFALPNAFLKTPVVTGQSNERFIEIVQGLLPADEVVTQGAYSLAFAGGGTVSLKAALDAAHGHEHNEDGSEMTPEQRRASEAAKAAASGRVPEAAQSPFWMIVSAVLFIALIIVAFAKRKGDHGADSAVDSVPQASHSEKNADVTRW